MSALLLNMLGDQDLVTPVEIHTGSIHTNISYTGVHGNAHSYINGAIECFYGGSGNVNLYIWGGI